MSREAMRFDPSLLVEGRRRRPILWLGHPALRQTARVVEPSQLKTDAFRRLIGDMARTLEDEGGVGLAGPQIGVDQRVILAGAFPSERDPSRPNHPVRAFINPVIVARSSQVGAAYEGCLSIPGILARVARPHAVEIEYLDLNAMPRRLRAEGFLARVLQHEIDHLDGVLIVDHARSFGEIVSLDWVLSQMRGATSGGESSLSTETTTVSSEHGVSSSSASSSAATRAMSP